jgi:hypothetical protein
MAGPYDIFITIGQSNSYSSYHRNLALDTGHSRIFQMMYNEVSPNTGPWTISQVTGEPLSYDNGSPPFPAEGPPVGHVLAFCRDYYLPNRLQPGRNILIIPCSLGGTGFSSVPSIGWGTDTNGVWGNAHERTINRVNAAMAANPGSVIKACLVQRGEEDAFPVGDWYPDGTDTGYYHIPGNEWHWFRDYTIAEAADFRARWTGGADVPFLYGRMSPSYITKNGYMPQSDYATSRIEEFVSNCAQIDATGLTSDNLQLDGVQDVYGGNQGDSEGAWYIHFDAISQRGGTENGRTETNPFSKRYWESYLTLEDDPPAPSDWVESRVRIGTGGWVVGGCISDDGSTVCAWGDVWGAFILNDTTGEWEDMMHQDRVPSSIVHVGNQSLASGALGVAVAPNEPTTIYVLIGCNETGVGWAMRVLKSVDRGATFTLTTNFAPGSQGSGNGIWRVYGPKIAVDPLNSEKVIVGLQNYGNPADGGTYLTTDGGTTWVNQNALGLPKAAINLAMTGLIFDKSIGVGGVSQDIFAYSGGNGLYRSRAGANWTQIADIATVPHVASAKQSKSGGPVYFAGENVPAAMRMGWRYYDNELVVLSPPDWPTTSCLIPSPTNIDNVVAMMPGGGVNISYDMGETWTGWSDYYINGATLTSSEIPWLSVTGGAGYQSTTNAVIDTSSGKFRSGKLIIFGGNGITLSDQIVPASGQISANCSFQTKGIELLNASQAQHPPGGKFLLTVQDRRAFFRGDSELQTYPSHHGFPKWNAGAIEYGSDCTWAKSNPNFLVGVAGKDSNDEGFSLDGGMTWNAWPTEPPRDQGPGVWVNGCMAAATDQNIIWWPTNRLAPFYTKDRGASWQYLNVGGDSGPGDWNYDNHWANWLWRRILDADNVNIGTYLLNLIGISNPTATAKAGLWLSNNLGDTWTKIHNGNLYNWQTHPKLRHVNGVGGAYIMTDGGQDSWAGELRKIVVAGGGTGTGAPTIAAYPGVIRCIDFGIGKLMSGKNWPRLWFVGWLNPTDTSTMDSSPNEYGVYYTDDADLANPTWTRVSAVGAPARHLDGVTCMAASPDTADLVVLGYGQSGFVEISRGMVVEPPSPSGTYIRSPYRRGGFRQGLL